ncbi:PqqD family peptide modification chaperone [Magnetovibrio sp.]|uniref:PqqD family peptide modification chaperone n=1 Tax=Magnetovibrio sp. TaxID=2024836 RepID=UPI002F922FF6
MNIDFRTTVIARHAETQFREVGDEIYLVHPDGEQIYNLNPMAAALWRLISEPMTMADMAEIVHAAFPILSENKVNADVQAVMTELLNLGFATAKP